MIEEAREAAEEREDELREEMMETVYNEPSEEEFAAPMEPCKNTNMEIAKRIALIGIVIIGLFVLSFLFL